jgi:hypothetical protein
LRCQFFAYQFARDLHGDFGLVGKSLGTSKPSIRRPDWTRGNEHGTVSFKHDKSGVLVGKPSQSGKRDRPVTSDYN